MNAAATARNVMVEQHIRARGVHDPLVLDAMRTVPREVFVPSELADQAYEDRPLPIEAGQTISQPYIVALMTHHLGPEPGDVILEIGAGSGYQSAILAELGCRVIALEILQPLVDGARATLSALGYHDVAVHCRDGHHGAPELAPPGGFDGILVAAAPAAIPSALRDQLAVGARLVIPVGPVFDAQDLVVVERHATGTSERSVLAVRFVPLIGHD